MEIKLLLQRSSVPLFYHSNFSSQFPHYFQQCQGISYHGWGNSNSCGKQPRAQMGLRPGGSLLLH